MDKVVCPHCKTHRLLAAQPPRDVVVVLPCPACHELVVLFREKIIALNRRIIEQGSKEERKMHFAEIIEEFLEAGLFTAEPDGDFPGASALPWAVPESDDATEASDRAPISQEELDRFLRIELKCIDNPAYFHRHFG